ncbi:MAG: 4Fe-4S binding protein, partial [Gemmatimonadetes bacterium]|nr:4Fe-4S binding protein [Gemmatimonadota bacterium]
VCYERCPVEGAIPVEAGLPTVDPSACTGCGICHYVCPAPENAVAILPRRERGVGKGTAAMATVEPTGPDVRATEEAPEADETPDPDALPEVFTALLTADQLQDLFRDLRIQARNVEVQFKDGATAYSSDRGSDLDAAEETLAAGGSVQIRYDAAGGHWCDTLRPVKTGTFLVRAPL